MKGGVYHDYRWGSKLTILYLKRKEWEDFKKWDLF